MTAPLSWPTVDRPLYDPSGRHPRTPGLAPVSDASFATWAAVAAVVLLTMLDLANYVSVIVPAILPKYLYLLEMALIAGLMAMSSHLELYRLRLPLIGFTLAVIAMNVFHGIFFEVGSSLDEVQGSAWTRVQYLLLALGIAMATTALSRRQLATIFAVAGFLAAASVIVDLMLPDLLYPPTTPGKVSGRAAGFFINANKPAETLVLCGLLAIPVLGPKSGLAFIAASGLAIFATFSRSGMVAWLMLIATYWWTRVLTRGQVIGLALAAAVLVASGGLLALLIESQDLSAGAIRDVSNRLNFLGSGDLFDSSAQSRGFILAQGIELYLQNPVSGAGAGATHVWQFDVSTHNFAVMMAAEYGLFGILTWLSLIALVATGGYFGRRDLQFVSALSLTWFSISTHNVLDFPYWMLGLLVLSMNFGAPDLRRSMIMGGGGLPTRQG